MSEKKAGIHRGVVSETGDPQRAGRVQVRVPEVTGDEQLWAPVAMLSAGSWFLPDPGDEVLVAFEAGDPRRPYVVGTLWDADAKPPESAAVIRTRGGATITLDADGSLELADAHGNTITLNASGISIRSPSRVSVKGAVVDVG